MSDHHQQIIPRPVLISAGAIMLLSIGLAGAARQIHLHTPAPAAAPALAAIDVAFADRPDGAIAMVDPQSGAELAAVPPRSNGFVRGVLRGMFRTRKLEQKGREGQFHLAREADGRLTLTDPQTGRRVDLSSFGPDNTAAFAQLLDQGVQGVAKAKAQRATPAQPAQAPSAPAATEPPR